MRKLLIKKKKKKSTISIQKYIFIQTQHSLHTFSNLSDLFLALSGTYEFCLTFIHSEFKQQPQTEQIKKREEKRRKWQKYKRQQKNPTKYTGKNGKFFNDSISITCLEI